MIRRAAPFPPPPGGREVVFTSALRFKAPYPDATQSAANSAPPGPTPAPAAPANPVAAPTADPNYAAAMMEKVKNARRYPKTTVNATVVAAVLFLIDKNGGLIGTEITKSSGYADYDAAALNAVRDAAPFAPPPPGTSHGFSAEIKFAPQAAAIADTAPAPPPEPQSPPTEPQKLCLPDVCIGDDLASLEKFTFLQIGDPSVQAQGYFLLDPAHIKAWVNLSSTLPTLDQSITAKQTMLHLDGDSIKAFEDVQKVCGYTDISGAFLGAGNQLTFVIVSTDTNADAPVFKVSAIEKEYTIASDDDFNKLVDAVSRLNGITLNVAASDADKHAMQTLMQQYWQYFYAYTNNVDWRYWAGDNSAIAIQRSGTRLIIQLFAKQGRAAVDRFNAFIKQKECPPPAPQL